jgi:hypothetical protein
MMNLMMTLDFNIFCLAASISKLDNTDLLRDDEPKLAANDDFRFQYN